MALGFILETDELFYDTLVPKGVKAVKDVIEPLPLLENTYWGSYTRAGITVGICTALLVLAGTNLNDTLSHMRAIEEEMCGGRKNFVVGLGTATDTSYAVEIRELDEGGEDAGVDFGGAAQARLRSDGVRDLVASFLLRPLNFKLFWVFLLSRTIKSLTMFFPLGLGRSKVWFGSLSSLMSPG